MYRVMVVEDEPSALQHICSIIEKKCPSYQVVARAENGEEALAAMGRAKPDIVITDVRMPRMDGIALVARLDAEWPEVATVIVSGYQDFEYAQRAIQSGVSDYLLKPLKPSDLQELLERMEAKLNGVYHRHRIELMKAMCGRDKHRPLTNVEKYFPSPRYYAVILRRNGLPRRFSQQTSFEIFATEEEKFMVYGRDEMEVMYLYPEELLEGQSFAEVAQALYEAELSDLQYVTAVIHQDSFSIREFPDVVKVLYRRLDERIIVGKNQFIDDREKHYQSEATPKEKEQRELVEYLIRSEDSAKLMVEMGRLFDLWNKAGHNQIYIENQISHLLHLTKRNYEFLDVYGSYTFLVNESLYYVNSMEELKLEVLALLKVMMPSYAGSEADDSEQLFDSILSYMYAHMEEPLKVNVICNKFNISQTTLSRWFRKYKSNSFNNYLSEIRITKAKQIMQQNPDLLIKDVARRVGYGDQFYFSRLFRSVAGLCPSDYVQKLQEISN